MTRAPFSVARRGGVKIFLTASIFFLCLRGLGSQSAVNPQTTPEEVVADFWKMETNGGTLTRSGWSTASSFFVRSRQQQAGLDVHVIDRTDNIQQTGQAKNWAEVTVLTNELGKINQALQFTRTPVPPPGGPLTIRGPWMTFNLVLTDKQWEVYPDGRRGQAIAGADRWLIDCAQATDPWLNIDTAIRYVNERRSASDNPVVRKNGGATIAALEKLKRRIAGAQ